MAQSVAKTFQVGNSYCHHKMPMILPLHENPNDSAKCLILLGSRGQKLGKMGFGVELGSPLHSMITAGLRRRFRISSASIHHKASQNIGCVMADNNLDMRNIRSACLGTACALGAAKYKTPKVPVVATLAFRDKNASSAYPACATHY
jgi:hypothetical protein